MSQQPSATDFGLGPEQEIWSGTPSQWSNFWPFASCLLIIGIPWAIFRYLNTRTSQYTLTNQRLKMDTGILSKTTHTMELYRIKDLSLQRSFFQRLFGLGSIHLNTSDETTPFIMLGNLNDPGPLYESIRANVERVRRSRRVTELDIPDLHHEHQH